MEIKSNKGREIKLPGQDHPIAISPAENRVRVTVAGRIVAESSRALRLEENGYPAVYYLPRNHADMSLLVRTEHYTYCPYKGDCTYYSIPIGGTRSENPQVERRTSAKEKSRGQLARDRINSPVESFWHFQGDTLVATMSDQNSLGCECLDHERATLDRPALFLPLIFVMFASFGFLLAFADSTNGVQFGSIPPYTCFLETGLPWGYYCPADPTSSRSGRATNGRKRNRPQNLTKNPLPFERVPTRTSPSTNKPRFSTPVYVQTGKLSRMPQPD